MPPGMDWLAWVDPSDCLLASSCHRPSSLPAATPLHRYRLQLPCMVLTVSGTAHLHVLPEPLCLVSEICHVAAAMQTAYNRIMDVSHLLSLRQCCLYRDHSPGPVSRAAVTCTAKSHHAATSQRVLHAVFLLCVV